MASERKPELVIVGTLKDKHGRTVKVGYRGGDVEIIVTPHSGHDGRMAFDGDGRDRFIKAWAQAEFAVEGISSQFARPCCDHCDNSAATGHGYGEIPHDGPCGECAAEVARRLDEAD